MKNLIALCFASFTMLFSFGNITNSVPEDKLERLKRMVWEYSRIGDYRLLSTKHFLDYARTNDIPLSTITSIAQSMITESRVIIESGGQHDLISGHYTQCSRMLSFLGGQGDKQVLPFLENISESTNSNLRLNASIAYVHLAGVDSIPFVQKAILDNRYTERERYHLYKELSDRISKEQVSKVKTDEAKTFLLKVAETENMGNAANELDKILCSLLPEYQNSMNRHENASRLSKISDDYYKDYFGKIKNEIEKTPKEKRKDFKAKGELLDPDRGK